MDDNLLLPLVDEEILLLLKNVKFLLVFVTTAGMQCFCDI